MLRPPPAIATLLKRVPGLQALVRRIENPDHFALEQSIRNGSRLAVLQPYTTSAEDRYPALFDRLARELGSLSEPRILSFGCAGGEEVRALRKRLPRAHITGIDVNPRAVARARRMDRNPRSRYLLADRPLQGETFDSILALSVFRHGTLERETPDSCADVLPFARVAEVLSALDEALRPGGWLAFGHAQFRLADVPATVRFTCETRFPDELAVSTVLYGPDDRLIEGATDSGGLYRKPG
ncbi:class I SAM-dependent methyltransferase [Tsuneonella mangrovi]|uniref:class I SAM-dependent methyltransferase n=1 Tax=Tsuneonella mangrovi TaxID=1982042 RepID=UPI000BA2B465|nr:class I SAM-dependent methyltransferase [Tsuneonella mangrovi]